MPKHYWAVRPISTKEQIRIEHAIDPKNACRMAFGKSRSAFEAKDLGTRIAVIHSDRKRMELLRSTDNWVVIQ